jgi:glucan phosphoethanolaminetransferase (alkaline phosphatase superfamily)
MWAFLVECLRELILCASAPVYLIYILFRRLYPSCTLCKVVPIACVSLLIPLLAYISASTSIEVFWQENYGLPMVVYRFAHDWVASQDQGSTVSGHNN